MKYLSILDQHGRKIPSPSAYTGGPFEGSGAGRRLATWGTSSLGPSTVLYWALQSLRARTRELVRNNPIAESGVESWVANLIGTGLTPRWNLDSADIKAQLQELWSDWTKEADAYDATDFYGLQAMAARSMIESGEVIVRLRPRPIGFNATVPLQLQLIEADHLDETYQTITEYGNVVRMGIEFDGIGQRQAYWLWRDHPGEMFLNQDTTTRYRIPAGEVLHIFRPLRPGQARGRPWLTSIIVRLHELDQYEDAELVRKKTAAMFGGFIEEPPGEDVEYSPLGKKADQDREQRDVVALEPGTFPVLPPGMKVNFSTPTDVGLTYEVWIKQNLREIAVGMGVTYDQLTGDLTDVNYSSIRAGLLEFRRRCEMLQQETIVYQFCRPVVNRWLDLVFMLNIIPLPGYAQNKRQYRRVEWRPQGWDWVDPLKDLLAQQLAVRCGFKSRSAVIAEQGYDREIVDRQIKEDNDSADALGLVLDSDPRRVQKTGQAQPPDVGAAGLGSGAPGAPGAPGAVGAQAANQDQVQALTQFLISEAETRRKPNGV